MNILLPAHKPSTYRLENTDFSLSNPLSRQTEIHLVKDFTNKRLSWPWKFKTTLPASFLSLWSKFLMGRTVYLAFETTFPHIHTHIIMAYHFLRFSSWYSLYIVLCEERALSCKHILCFEYIPSSPLPLALFPHRQLDFHFQLMCTHTILCVYIKSSVIVDLGCRLDTLGQLKNCLHQISLWVHALTAIWCRRVQPTTVGTQPP